MAADSVDRHDADLIGVINESERDDLVQVLGVVPSENEDEIMVRGIEIDDGNSIFIDVEMDVDPPTPDTDEFINMDDVDDGIRGGDVISE